jgi:tRNA isopentenyl-2-thiomethyl-A-37 hydroxylase MiaE
LDADQRGLLLFALSSLIVAEERITTKFSGLLGAHGTEEEATFLAAQQVDEARHMQFYARFQDEVIAAPDIINAHVREPEEEPDLSWIELKRRYLAHLPQVTDDAVLRVALADKVQNARSIVRDYRQEGRALWDRFTQTTARQLSYYGALLTFFQARRPCALTEDLDRAVSELSWLVALDSAERAETIAPWLDRDLDRGQAPGGWIQVRTAWEATELMDRHAIRALSAADPGEASGVIEWLHDQESRGLGPLARAVDQPARPLRRQRR